MRCEAEQTAKIHLRSRGCPSYRSFKCVVLLMYFNIQLVRHDRRLLTCELFTRNFHERLNWHSCHSQHSINLQYYHADFYSWLGENGEKRFSLINFGVRSCSEYKVAMNPNTSREGTRQPAAVKIYFAKWPWESTQSAAALVRMEMFSFLLRDIWFVCFAVYIYIFFI